MFKNHLKIVFRTLWRAKGYTAINIFGLAIGLTCVTLIAAWSLDELSYDRFHTKHERIYRVTGQVNSDSENFVQAVTPPPLAKMLQNEFPEVEDAVRLDRSDCIVRYGSSQFVEDEVLFVDDSFFDVFDFPGGQVNMRIALSEPYSIILTESIAKKYFGEENPIGKTMTLYIFDPEGNGAPYKVTGVVPDPPQNSHFDFRILGSFKTYEAVVPDSRERWFFNRFHTYVLLANGADPLALERKLPGLVERHIGDRMRSLKIFYTFNLQPLTDIYLLSNLRYEISSTGSMNTVYIFATIGLFILLIASINYMNLATARSLGRAREVGIKKVLGAARQQLVRQFLLESTAVAAIALVIALLLVETLQPAFLQLTGKNLDQAFTADLLLIVTFITLLVGFLSGLYPAFFISSLGAIRTVQGSFKSSSTGIFLRKGLVVLQFSIAIVLLVGIAVVKMQMDYIGNKDLGFNKEELLILNVHGFSQVRNGIAPFRDDLLSNPAVKGVSTSRGVNVGGLGNIYIETIDGSGKSLSTSIYRHRVGLDHLGVYGIELIAGRDFTPGDTLGRAFIINETAVNSFGWGDPQNALDKPISDGGPVDGRVIGVVKDFNYTSLQETIAPVALMLTRPYAFSRISIRLAASNLSETVEFIEATWRRHFPAALLEYSFMNERLDNQYRRERLFSNIFLAFVIFSLVIACLGLFGLAAYAAEQRTKEIGVRKVLGATVLSVVGLVSRDFVKLVLLANVIAWPIAWYLMTHWLENFAYRIEIGWQVFIFAGLLALLIAILTVSSQAIRAALVDPAKSLRYE